MVTITEHEQQELDAAQSSGRTPVVFVHGLWLLPNSWDRWRVVFEDAGYATLAPGWPDDPDTVEEARAHPEVFARKNVGDIAEHFGNVIRKLDTKPAVVGHSFGGLLTEILAGRGLAAASVAISPAPFRGVLPLPISALRAGSPVLRNPLNRHRAIPLTFEQFRYSFANAVDEGEAKQLYEIFAVPGSGEPIFEAASANLNPWTEVKVRSKNPRRGPMLIISGDRDHTVPWAIANASYKKQKRNQSVTEIVKIADRGHALTIDHGWREVAETALQFVQRFLPPAGEVTTP
jgi:pimeloyl-ACP methyl ester carboxylesterase